MLVSAAPTGRVVALSPHLDDIAFSLGATLFAAARAGAEVHVVTVFAGDPDSTRPSGEWDRRAGFATEGEAARRRREEDAEACARLGITPSWLALPDRQYSAVAPDDVWRAVEPLFAGADAVLLPGFPLDHADHVVVTSTVVERLPAGPRIGLYVEQPYAMMIRREVAVPDPGREPSSLGDVEWHRLRPSSRAWVAKQRALRAYRSQLLAIAWPLQRVPALVARHERQVGGETVGWLSRPHVPGGAETRSVLVARFWSGP